VVSARLRSSPVVRVGFVPLIDAAPLIVARETGLFDEVGLRVELHRQIGWGNVRDRLLFGQLDAAHALLGLAPAARIAAPNRPAPIINVMSLGTGGDAVTLSRRFVDAGVNSAAMLGQYLKSNRLVEPPVFGHVFQSSVHHYLLREWLSRGQIDPDVDVRLTVVPPILAASQMQQRHLDGFCVGEPWNLIAQREQSGKIVALTTDILESHPDKMLAVRRDLLDNDPATVFRLIMALIRAAEFCADPARRAELARMLSLPQYLDVDVDVLTASLSLDRHFNLRSTLQHFRRDGWHMRSFAAGALFPNLGFCHWLIEQMVRWSHVDPLVDVPLIATACTHTDSFREAAATIGIDCPADDLTRIGTSVARTTALVNA
jgi:two-component system, oxyanion-binding sensor